MIKIKEKEILINNVCVFIKTDAFILININCKSKHPEKLAYGDNEVWLIADENTLYKGDKQGPTLIEIDMPKGFRIGAVTILKYNVKVYCYNHDMIDTNRQYIWEA